MNLRLPLLAVVPALATAQVYTPPPEGGSEPPPARETPPASRESSEEREGGTALGNELPFFDPSNETVTWNGRTWSATDNRLLSARFERYLNEPADASEEAREYRDTIDRILALVAPQNPGGPDFAAAVALLPRASAYPGDSKLCDSLSQAIYAAVLSKKDVLATKRMMEALEKEKERMIRSADVIARRSGMERTRTSRTENTVVSEEAPKTGTGTDSMEYKNHIKRVVEIDAMREANRAKGELQIVQAKAQYQYLMLQFFVQRRFEHVLMASRFYHQLFQDGDNQLHIDEGSDMAKLFGESLGTSPTVSALDSLASEAIRDVQKGVDAFEFLSERGELESAAKRLSEAYLVGEFMPSIQTLERDKKRRVLEFVRQSYQLVAALEARDYATARELLDRLSEEASDFDTTQARALIATSTRVSNMHIDAAKLAASQGDHDKAAGEIRKAMEEWPQNPKLGEFDRIVEQGGALARARNDFDRLLSERNYREIYRRQYELAPAIHGDVQREDAFQQIIANIYRIDGALEKASEFRKMGQAYAAYEELALLREDFPDDPRLGREIELLAPQVADFTKALDHARQFEQRSDRQTGSALSWYLKARSIHPRSRIAQDGIDRLVEGILPSGDGASAAATGQDD